MKNLIGRGEGSLAYTIFVRKKTSTRFPARKMIALQGYSADHTWNTALSRVSRTDMLAMVQDIMTVMAI